MVLVASRAFDESERAEDGLLDVVEREDEGGDHRQHDKRGSAEEAEEDVVGGHHS